VTTHIWWIRRDLRLDNNPALQAAVKTADVLIPLFILDEHLLDSSSEKRRLFLFDGLRQLDAGLRALGSRLILMQGDPVAVFAELNRRYGPVHVFAEEDFSPFARRRDKMVSAQVPLSLPGCAAILHPAQVRKADGQPYTVFTPYSHSWLKVDLPEAGGLAPLRLPLLPADIESEAMPISPPVADFAAGEQEAARRAEVFLEGRLAAYAEQRDRLDLPGTSVLSPYIKFGMISPLKLAQQVKAKLLAAGSASAESGPQKYLNELIWRDFYQQILCHYPHVLKGAFNPALLQIPWRNGESEFSAWKEGRTGVPIVDACMRQMLETGWMHNRGRMIVASFLVKDLLIDWQWGERFFMQTLIDGDPAANNGGWQWTAGVGTDAAPYFRIFNPVRQSEQFDPDGDFICRWVPELARVPRQYIHSPWKMPADAQNQCGCRIGINYPFPIVDHAQARQRTLDAFQQSKDLYNSTRSKA
jgi:deoxyribodipyrimidine photo-lyase